MTDQVPRTAFFVKLCLFTVFTVLFSFSITNSAGRYILGALGGSNTTASYTLAFYGMGNAVTIPLAFHMCERFGIKRFLLFCLYLFTFFTALSAFSMTYVEVCILRFLQGNASGPIMIAIVKMLSKLSTQEEKDNFVRNIVIVFMSGSIVGAAIGGSIAYFFTWHHIFHFNALLLLITSITMTYQLRGVYFSREKKTIDWIGFAFYVVGISSIGTFLTLGQQLDWFRSQLLTSLFITSCICLPYFLIRTWGHPNPLINYKILRHPSIAFGMFQIVFLFSSYFGMTILIALWLNLYVHYDVNWVGIVLASTAATIFLVMLILGKMKIRSGIPALIVATLLLSLSCYMTMHFNANVDLPRIVYSRVMAGLGLGLMLPPLFNLLLSQVCEGEGVHVIVLFQMVRSFSSAMGASIYTTIWQRRTVFYHERLGSSLTTTSTQNYLDTADLFTHDPTQSLNFLSEGLQRQSISLALNDTFYLMAIILFIMFVLNFIYLLKPKIKKLKTACVLFCRGKSMWRPRAQ